MDRVKHADVTRTSGSITIDLWPGGDKFENDRFNIPEK